MLSSKPIVNSVADDTIPGVSISPGAVDAEGVSISPGAGGGAGVPISPAKTERPSVSVKKRTPPNLFRLFMFSPLVQWFFEFFSEKVGFRAASSIQ
jgi:hypothetical protein